MNILVTAAQCGDACDTSNPWASPVGVLFALTIITPVVVGIWLFIKRHEVIRNIGALGERAAHAPHCDGPTTGLCWHSRCPYHPSNHNRSIN